MKVKMVRSLSIAYPGLNPHEKQVTTEFDFDIYDARKILEHHVEYPIVEIDIYRIPIADNELLLFVYLDTSESPRDLYLYTISFHYESVISPFIRDEVKKLGVSYE